VSNEFASAALLVAGGVFFTVRCTRSAIREVRTGVGRSRFGEYERESEPLQFWATFAGSILAALLGVIFFCSGLAMLLGPGWHR